MKAMTLERIATFALFHAPRATLTLPKEGMIRR
jgi:hypothetical protein